MNALAAPLPTTSQGYPFAKDLLAYSAEGLGRAFFADGVVTGNGGLHVFDNAGLMHDDHETRLRYEPVQYNDAEIQVYLYTASAKSEIEDRYDLLDLRIMQVGIFAWVYEGQIEFRLKLGSALIKPSLLATAEAVRQVRVVRTVEAIEAQPLSASRLLSLFDQGQERLFDPLQVGSPKDLAKATNSIASHYEATPIRRLPPPLPIRPGQIDVVVGLFFDGTGNNRYCTELIYNRALDPKTGKLDHERLEQFKKEISDPYGRSTQLIRGEDFMVTLKEPTSYLGPYSNIVLLHDLYQTRAYNSNLRGRQEVILKHYVQGIGTLVDLGEDGLPIEDGYHKDDVMGSASGRGLRGVINRVEQALTHVAKQLQKLLSAPGTQLGVLTVDVFGFSRGATAARHCLNELLRPVQKGSKELQYGRLGKALAAVQVPLPRRLDLRFAGLFDTVVSDSMSLSLGKKAGIIAAAAKHFEGDSIDYETFNNYESIYTSLKKFPGKAIHITASDDYRENFPLTLNDAPNRLDIDLFGAHSDVGGGYEVDDLNTVVEYGDYIYMQGLKDSVDKQKLLDIDAAPHRERFTRVLKNGRWVVDNIAERTESQRRILVELDPSLSINRITSIQKDHYYIVDKAVGKAVISNKLPLVALRIILQCALAEGLPFQVDLRKAKVPHAGFYELPKDPVYLRYYDSVMKLLKEAKNQKDNEITIPHDVYYPLSERYIHESANYNSSLIFSARGDNYSLYANKANTEFIVDDRPTGDRRRERLEPASREK